MRVLRLLRIKKVMKSFTADAQKTQTAAEDNNTIFFFVSLTPIPACLCVLRVFALNVSGSPHPTFGHQ